MDYTGLSDIEDDSGPAFVVAATSIKAVELGEHLKTDTEWAALGLAKPLLKALRDLGYSNPTPIQRDTIPLALAGRDILGRAETGSGKTCAFLLPCLDRLLQSAHVRRRKLDKVTGKPVIQPGDAVTKVLVLLPTRELAQQCFNACEGLKKYCPITSVLLTGGLSNKQQEQAMRTQPDIVIATPGRCLDLLLNSVSTNMDLLDIVVFDEADRLVDMGFKDECLAVLGHCSHQRQTLLFSATLDFKADELSVLALNNPVYVPKDEAKSCVSRVAQSLDQSFISINFERERLPVLLALLERETKDDASKKIVVFFNTKRLVHKLSLILQTSEIRLPAYCELHGDLDQLARRKSLESFESCMTPIMLCTDIAARGLDLDNVSVVINAEVPNETEKYVHRIGRTARRGLKGRAITIFSQKEKTSLRDLVKRVTEKQIEFSSDKLPNGVIEDFQKKIKESLPRVKELVKLERTEKMLERAERMAKKDRNMVIYADEIFSRPPKENWSKDKDKSKAPKKRKIIKLDPKAKMEADVKHAIRKKKRTE
eukprot:Blabericola_migrator_1__4248@NODE_22_length_22262_cov_139_742014_g19_i0_p4_GENE_NODE_22_length_22262_cov_139_742014_g19_i0NODE_22_length_22262_cov_139_742014_g19_i0_p4_ORF_typecomplete_len540_score101_15DEAD/PF00270_29/1_2e47DEAD/PF00270_29/1_1e02Helicase_C/PF00271_31/1_6Helicase_C/PF00271_31/4_9e03Helicase_C/PF00271_31/2_2e24ResIII/PF04851_15/4_6e11ResIII/PF04851_15/6_8e02UTP25/PF06862_12/10UTP25/PF06862_12/0_034Flavi_DEAD/PF07652_14/0_078Flavi_DEAD/PF07652_14/6_8e03AAA_22/PF13401_6/0_13AAA_22/